MRTLRSRILLALLFLAPLCSGLHAQAFHTAGSLDDTLAVYQRLADSLMLVETYGRLVTVGDILDEGYDLAAIGEGTMPGDHDDTIHLFARRSPSSGWLRQKSPFGHDQGLIKVEAKCQESLLQMGEYASFKEVAPGTIGAAILRRICRKD